MSVLIFLMNYSNGLEIQLLKMIQSKLLISLIGAEYVLHSLELCTL